jgi:hypothetical protein
VANPRLLNRFCKDDCPDAESSAKRLRLIACAGIDICVRNDKAPKKRHNHKGDEHNP